MISKDVLSKNFIVLSITSDQAIIISRIRYMNSPHSE